ncbi:MAG TPA: DUF362 domain-containing protein [Armatimonadota bacterium]
MRTRTHLSLLGWLALAAALVLPALGPARAQEAAPPPVLSPVGLARADHLYLPGPVFAPAGVYPSGKVDWEVVDGLVKNSSHALGLASPWPLFQQTDRVALMVDVADPPVELMLVEAVLEQIIQAGVRPENLFIFSARESDLFAAGFALGDSGPGVRVYGADRAGYRGGYSRLVLDQCDKIVNLACLRPHAVLGMTGALYNCLSAVDPPTMFRLLASPPEIGSVLARPPLAGRVVLHLLDCTNPFYELPTAADPKPRWEYRGLLCSRDPVALDALGRQLLEAKRALVKGAPWPLTPAPDYVQAAADQWKIGRADPEHLQLKVVGDRTDLLLPAPAE